MGGEHQCVYRSHNQYLCGAGGGTRTHTGIRPSDFKSDMSTIPSRPQCVCHRGLLKGDQALKPLLEVLANRPKRCAGRDQCTFAEPRIVFQRLKHLQPGRAEVTDMHECQGAARLCADMVR